MRAYLSLTTATPAALASLPDALVLECAGTEPAALSSLLATLRAERPETRNATLCVRVSAVDTPGVGDELAAWMPVAPLAIVLPVRHGRDVAHAGARLAVHEAECGLPDESTRIVALIASAEGVLNAGSLVGSSPRLVALGWDAGVLAAELRLERTYEDGTWIAPLAQARGLVRLAAAASRVEAVEAACPDDGEAALRRHVAAARRDGFGAVFVTEPAQVSLVREP